MKKTTTKILLLALLGGAGIGFAQTVQKITLSEAVALSVKNNSKVKISEAQLNTMDSRVQEAKNKRLPDLTLSGNLMKPFNTMDIKSSIPALSGGGPAPSPDYVAIQQLNFGMPLLRDLKLRTESLLQSIRNLFSSISWIMTSRTLPLQQHKDLLTCIKQNRPLM